MRTQVFTALPFLLLLPSPGYGECPPPASRPDFLWTMDEEIHWVARQERFLRLKEMLEDMRYALRWKIDGVVHYQAVRVEEVLQEESDPLRQASYLYLLRQPAQELVKILIAYDQHPNGDRAGIEQAYRQLYRGYRRAWHEERYGRWLYNLGNRGPLAKAEWPPAERCER